MTAFTALIDLDLVLAVLSSGSTVARALITAPARWADAAGPGRGRCLQQQAGVTCRESWPA